MYLSPEMLDNFSQEQLGQLYELFQETTKMSSKEAKGNNNPQQVMYKTAHNL